MTISDINLADLSWARAEGTVRNLADRRFDLYDIKWANRPTRQPVEQVREAPTHGSHGPGGG